MDLRREFVLLAQHPDANVRALCARFGISRKSGYKWLARYRTGGLEALQDRSRRPHGSPGQTVAPVEAEVLALRTQHPAWGPRKLRRRLEDLGAAAVPARSTIGVILQRHGRIAPAQTLAHQPCQRFERARPNELWQMDFKGDFALSRGGRCFPLPILDDHSRFLLGLFACGNQQERTVRGHLEALFERYGLPEELLCDNGAPWGAPGGEWTRLRVWLLRHGVRMTHGRPYHPQTQGKEERFNRTLKAEVLQRHDLRDLEMAERHFAQWREVYNLERPHEALALAVPATRYVISPRRYQAQLPVFEYAPDDVVRAVHGKGQIAWKGRNYFIGEAFAGEKVALRPGGCEHLLGVYFCHQRLGEIDLRLQGAKRQQQLPIRPPQRRRHDPAKTGEGEKPSDWGGSPPVTPPLRSGATSGKPPQSESPLPTTPPKT